MSHPMNLDSIEPKLRYVPPKAVGCWFDECHQPEVCRPAGHCCPAPGLRKLETKVINNRLSEIASLTRKLTYGEMMELAAGIWGMKGEGVLDDKTLPGVLWKWSTKQ